MLKVEYLFFSKKIMLIQWFFRRRKVLSYLKDHLRFYYNMTRVVKSYIQRRRQDKKRREFHHLLSSLVKERVRIKLRIQLYNLLQSIRMIQT